MPKQVVHKNLTPALIIQLVISLHFGNFIQVECPEDRTFRYSHIFYEEDSNNIYYDANMVDFHSFVGRLERVRYCTKKVNREANAQRNETKEIDFTEVLLACCHSCKDVIINLGIGYHFES